jgi:hypothetical protein
MSHEVLVSYGVHDLVEQLTSSGVPIDVISEAMIMRGSVLLGNNFGSEKAARVMRGLANLFESRRVLV